MKTFVFTCKDAPYTFLIYAETEDQAHKILGDEIIWHYNYELKEVLENKKSEEIKSTEGERP